MGKHKDCAACAAHEPCPAWDRAAYYDTDEDAERLQYTTEFDAIGEFFDELESEDLAQLLEGDGYENPLEVYAFERDAPPDDAWFKRTASWMTDHAIEQWTENYGDSEAEDPALNDDERAPLEVAIALMLRGTFAKKETWQCQQTCSRTYDGPRLVAIVTEELRARAAAAKGEKREGAQEGDES